VHWPKRQIPLQNPNNAKVAKGELAIRSSWHFSIQFPLLRSNSEPR
jgi:hypothetical protein